MYKRKRAVALLLCAAMMIGVSCNKDSKNDAPNSSGLNSDTPVNGDPDTSSARNYGLTDGGTVILEDDPFFDIVDTLCRKYDLRDAVRCRICGTEGRSGEDETARE